MEGDCSIDRSDECQIRMSTNIDIDVVIEAPKVGMEFDTYDALTDYYARYARQEGFAVSRRSSKKGKDGKMRYGVVECYRGGKPRSRGANKLKPRPQSKLQCPRPQSKLGLPCGLACHNRHHQQSKQLLLLLDFYGDVACLDADLWQLPGVSPLSMKANPVVPEKLFDQWLSLPETASLVKSQVNNAKGGGPLNISGASVSPNASSSNSIPSMFSAGSTPPLSPRSSSGSPQSVRQRAGPSVLGYPLKLVNEPVKKLIPQFYFQNGRPPPNEIRERCLFMINQFFYGHTDGLQMHGCLHDGGAVRILSSYKGDL